MGRTGLHSNKSLEASYFYSVEISFKTYINELNIKYSLTQNVYSLTPADTPTDNPIHTITDSPMDVFTDSPIDAFTDSPIDTFTDSPMDAFTDSLIQ